MRSLSNGGHCSDIIGTLEAPFASFITHMAAASGLRSEGGIAFIRVCRSSKDVVG